MKKRLPALLWLLLWCTAAAAQTFRVSGRTCEDSKTPNALPLVSVQLLTKDSTVIAHQVTGNDGRFSLTAKRAGQYIVRATFVGYRTVTRDVALTAQRPEARLGDLRMSLSDVLLREAQVESMSSVLTIKADTFIYSTAALRIPPGSSLSVLIKQMPGLELDKEGKLRFQGKEVGSVLVNGKEFFSDIVTALQNMPAEAIQNIKTYEKTDEEKEFRGEQDNDRQTVLDLTIKREYMASWNVNTDLAGGTGGHYALNAFASTFTDRRRLALYGSLNDVGNIQHVDENGNWRMFTSPNGIYTNRTAGMMYAYDNGRKTKESGYFKANFNADLYHSNCSRDRWYNTQRFLPDGSAHYSYEFTHAHTRNVQPSANASLTWNIDSLNRVNASASYQYQLYRIWQHSDESAFDSERDGENPWAALTTDNPDEEALENGIYAQSNRLVHRTQFTTVRGTLGYTRRFNRDGRSLTLTLTEKALLEHRSSDDLDLYRFFQPGATDPERTKRSYEHPDNTNTSLTAIANYGDKLNEHFSYVLGYTFTHLRDNSRHTLYDLERYERYADLLLPVGMRPTTADSLNAVIDVANSYCRTLYANSHKALAVLNGTWKKLEASAGISMEHNNEHLYYEREDMRLTPSRRYTELNPAVMFKYKPTGRDQLTIQYNAINGRSELSELLPVSDTSDDLSIERNNPDLKDYWQNYFGLRASHVGARRQDSYTLNFNYTEVRNKIVNTMTVDPLTGVRITSKANVPGNGNHSFSLSFGTNQPLDTARHWTLSINSYAGLYQDKNYLDGNTANKLTTAHRQNITFHPTLRWRQGVWSVALRSGYICDRIRYKEYPDYNDTGHTVEVFAYPQVDFPFGLSINTNFGLYKRFNYGDALLNHSQWLWNAGISQTFLRSKALTVRLEYNDILRQRSSESNTYSHTTRSYSRNNGFLSYGLVHIIYRFNKKR